MSPTRSRIVAPARSRTATSSSRVAIVASSEVEDELDLATSVLAPDVRLVDHLLDQEQAPPARRLLAGELRLDVRRLGRGELERAAVVDHLHAQAIGGAQDAYRDGAVGAVRAAVLHRVHRGLSDRGLQAL